ncbi:MAG: DNA-binding protein [Actinobacteria bacterium]|nr:DNA-binding protein [Actinomycetota bacterium]
MPWKAPPITVIGVLMTVEEACQELRCHKATFWRWVAGDPAFPPVIYIGRRSPRVRREDLVRWINFCPTRQARGTVHNPRSRRRKPRGPQRKESKQPQ